jgi:hypothetical protein
VFQAGAYLSFCAVHTVKAEYRERNQSFSSDGLKGRLDNEVVTSERCEGMFLAPTFTISHILHLFFLINHILHLIISIIYKNIVLFLNFILLYLFFFLLKGKKKGTRRCVHCPDPLKPDFDMAWGTSGQ